MEEEVWLDKIYIKNFLSLRDVEIPLKSLTVLVGPNASGKSNVVLALEFLQMVVISENLPTADDIKKYMWAGGADKISLKIDLHAGEKQISYRIELQPEIENLISKEELIVAGVKVISVEKGEGEVRDEDDKNPVPFRSKKLALRSAGDYGNKPITNNLTEFIHGWYFYNFRPEFMRDRDPGLAQHMRGSSDILTYIDAEGLLLQDLLYDWYDEYSEGFEAVNKGLEDCVGFTIEPSKKKKGEVQLREGYKNPIPLARASDGTLRLLAYHVLLNQPSLDTLIVIEEPERNLHPAMLEKIGNLLERLAEVTQVIVTTHSSQLLDTFNASNLSDNLRVLLLQNKPGVGTQVINLEEVRNNREALKEWIEDFGIGSAIFDSELLQDMMES